jgi:hypothetical protein
MFEPYHGLVWQARQTMRAAGNRRLDGMEQMMIDVGAKMLLETDPGMNNNGVAHVLFELVHYWLSHRVIYVPTPLAQRLMATKLDIPAISLKTSYQLFEMSFDDKLEVRPGVRIASCLAVVLPDEGLMSALHTRLKQCSDRSVDALNHLFRSNIPKKPYQEVEIAARTRRSFYIVYSLYGRAEICQIHFRPDEHVGKSLDDVADELLGTGIPGFRPLDKEEIEVEKALCRIVFGSLCYLGTKEPEVDEWKDRCRPRLGITPKGIILGKSIKSAVGWHLRKAHWRFFKHEKFSVPYTWVHSAEINAGLKPSGQDEKSEVLPDEQP